MPPLYRAAYISHWRLDCLLQEAFRDIGGGEVFWLSRLLRTAVGPGWAGVTVAKPSAAHGTILNKAAASCPKSWHYTSKNPCAESMVTLCVIQPHVLPGLFFF